MKDKPRRMFSVSDISPTLQPAPAAAISMTDHKMPLILDNPMDGAAMQVSLDDVDDLFGDGVPLSLAAQRPPSRRVLQRLDQLRTRGCCQSLAWSKAGTIASIAPDGQTVDVRYIRADPRDGSWGLSDVTPFPASPNLIGGPLVHLSWGPTTAPPELAVIDAVGRVLILNFSTNLNRPSVHRRWDTDPVDDLHAVVGCNWLNTMQNPTRPSPIHGPAIKDGNNYTYETAYALSHGPHHPNPNRSAFVCVTTNGLFKLFWNQNNGKIEETKLELESVTSTDDLITHAAMTGDKSKLLLVALATTSKQLRVLQVFINWGLPKGEQVQGMPPAAQPLNPTLIERHVAVTSWFQPDAHEAQLDPSMTHLSFIDILPQIPDPVNRSWVPPQVLTVRSFVPEPNSPYPQEVQSIIDRWEILSEQPQGLHPAFEQLGSRRGSAISPSQPATRLRKLASVITSKLVIGIAVLHLGKTLCITYSDGSIEYRDRTTMNEIYTSVNLDRIHSILEAGFVHTTESSCLQTALSPANVSAVQMTEDGRIKWHCVQYTLGDPASLTDTQLSAVVAGATIATTQAVANGSNIDDILALGRNFTVKPRFAHDWVTEMVRMMRVPVDYSEDSHHDNLVRNHYLQLCLSSLNHLGWKGEFKSRNFGSKLSMLALNLRNIVILVTIANNSTNFLSLRSNMPLDDPEVVDALAGCCKWSIDLVGWLSDSLFCLMDDAKFMDLLNERQFSEVTPYLHSKNDVALHLLLSSATRGLISAVCRRVMHLETLSIRAEGVAANQNNNTNASSGPKSAGPSLPLYSAYQKIRRYTSSSLVKVSEFDALLSNLGSSIREAYQKSLARLGEQAASKVGAQPGSEPGSINSNNNPAQNDVKAKAAEEVIKRAQSHSELNILLGASPPQSFLPVIRKFFAEDLVAFRAQTDPARLYFADFGILEVYDEPRALAARRRRGARVDLFRRVELVPPKGIGGCGGGGGEDGNENGGVGRGGNNNTNGLGNSNGNGNKERDRVPWRRCARCASVMEDISVVSNKTGIQFVLSQQRNCCCGGRLAQLDRKKAIP